MVRTVVIVDAVRTPVGKYRGALSRVRPDDLGAHVIQTLISRHAHLDPLEIEDVLMGCANQAGEDNRNVARMAVLLAGLPESVAGGTVNRLCGSGLMAVNQAAQAIHWGEGDIYLAGGLESMTRAPWVMGKPADGFSRGNQSLYDTTLGWRFTNPALAEKYYPYAMGETAENVAKAYQITRTHQDQFSLESQRKAGKAIQEGKFESEIIPVPVPQKRGPDEVMTQDEHPRPDTTLADLEKLKPVFAEEGTVTAGNSSGINDGAACLLLMSEAKANALDLKPMARVVSTAVAGVDPAMMGLGPVPATNKVLHRAGLSLADLDLVELNEAFAAQSLACLQDLQLNPEQVNVNGGAIALGHPLGCSGARILTTLLHEMQRREGVRYGLATMCIGVGQGIATLVEKL